MQKRSAIVLTAITLTMLLAPSHMHAAMRDGVMQAPVRLSSSASEPGVQLALKDLAGDFERSFGTEPQIRTGRGADLAVEIDRSNKKPESWTIKITESKVVISGSDELGAIYGIYAFSRRFLGVDPLWFWDDQKLPRRQTLRLEPQIMHSQSAAFRYRGWFLNDEDLLCEWKASSGKRHIDYPYYGDVMSLDVADKVYEALLRSGGNLIIPGSFIDVMNPPEAALVQRAVQRGLYVTQHHIQPLGVSYLGFEEYWKEHGQDVKFSYGANPEKVRETWRIYAEKWYELCGKHVIWQLGLRGNGDRPVWASDPSIKQADAGPAISRAMADQWAIIHAVDPRPQPPATTTLWAECSELMQKGELTIPRGITLVFSDEGTSQKMQGDFIETPRTSEFTYGVYYHLAFFARGPHLIQGTRPDRLKATLDSVLAKGDTEYAILNVSNIRPFVLGIDAAMQIMQEGTTWKEQEFYSPVETPALQGLYRDLLDSLALLPDGRLLQDGTCVWMIKARLTAFENEKQHRNTLIESQNQSNDDKLTIKLDDSIARLRRVLQQYPPDGNIPVDQLHFYEYNLRNQAAMLIDYYSCLRDLIQKADDSTRLRAARGDIESLLAVRQQGAEGSWVNWYRGDRKENIPGILERIRNDESVVLREHSTRGERGFVAAN